MSDQARRRVHIVPAAIQGGWRIRVEGVGLLRPRFPLKRYARQAGRAIAELLEPAELIPHRRDGRIEKRGRETFPRSSDPSSSPG